MYLYVYIYLYIYIFIYTYTCIHCTGVSSKQGPPRRYGSQVSVVKRESDVSSHVDGRQVSVVMKVVRI